jgi:succinoglycan biosynthesis transport protein ExoP
VTHDEWAPELREASLRIARSWRRRSRNAVPWRRPGDGRRPKQRASRGIAVAPRFTLGALGPWPRVLIAHWAWIVLMTVLVTGGATVLAELQTRTYRAQAEVAVYAAATGGTALQPFFMGTEKGIASSGDVLAIASQSLGISQARLRHGLSVSVPVDTDLLVISFTDPNPQLAQSVAEGVAQAYVAYRTWQAPVAPGKTAPTPPPGALQPAVVSDATLPAGPVSPNRRLIVGAALILGLALGIGLALVRDLIDDGLRGVLDLETQAETAVLGQIPAFRRKRGSLADRLVILRNPTSTVADAYRNLRTRVLQAAASRRTNLLLITSPTREDKSTVAANLAAALALSGRRVVLVCADLHWGQAHTLFGLDNQVGLVSLVNEHGSLTDALHWTEVPRLQVLPAGPPSDDPSSVLQSAAFRKLLTKLRSEADVVLVDAPPVLAGADTPALAELGGMILLVADARRSTRAEVRAATHDLGPARNTLIGCVLANLGRPIRLTEAFAPAGLTDVEAARSWSRQPTAWQETIVNEHAVSNRGVTAVAIVNGHGEPEKEHEATSIYGEV